MTRPIDDFTKSLTPKLRGNDAKHYCPLERTVRQVIGA